MSVKTKLAGLGAGIALGLAMGLTSFEGNKAVPYRDIGGVWTACVGDTHAIDPGHIYSPQECQDRLAAQLDAHNDELVRCMPDVLQAPDHTHAALLDLAYNIGVPAVCRSSINAKVRTKQYPAACQTITEFRFAAGRDCSARESGCYGVWKRRQWERAMCEGALGEQQIAQGYAGYLEASK